MTVLSMDILAGKIFRHGAHRMKFGGTSVADVGHIRNVARHVKREVDAGRGCCRGLCHGWPDQWLVAWTREISPLHVPASMTRWLRPASR